MKFSTKAKSIKRDGCGASVVSLSSQVSLSSKLSESSKSSMASSLAQAKLATTAAWTSIKKTTSALKKTCKKTCKTPLSPRPRSSVDNPFNDFTYRMDEPTRVSRLVNRLSRQSRQSRYSSIDGNEHPPISSLSYEDSDFDDDRDIFSGQPFWAGKEQSYSAATYNEKMTVVVTTEAHAHGARYANAAPYERIDDEWYL